MDLIINASFFFLSEGKSLFKLQTVPLRQTNENKINKEVNKCGGRQL